MMRFFELPLNAKMLLVFLGCYCFLSLDVQAQTRSLKQATVKKPAAPVAQVQPEPPNPYAEIDKKALLMPDSMTKSTEAIAAYINGNFSLDQDRIRAAFVWVAGNIRYDVPNMYAINYYEKKEDKIAKPLQTRQGICENYAALFTDICQKMGIPGFFVEGYVKLDNQISSLSHAWCVARIDSSWYLFDPTWASGYMYNGVFVSKINNAYYKTDPSIFIQTHMPFDPLWQLLYHPISFSDFNEGSVKESINGAVFNFPDSIGVYEKQNQSEEYQASYARIDNNGAKNPPVFNMLLYIRQRIQEIKVNEFNTSVATYNNAIANFNEFIRYKNDQFKPIKPDPEIQAMLDSASIPYNLAKVKLSQIKDPGPNITSMIATLQKQMNDLSQQLEEYEGWLAEYFSRGKWGRRIMFYKKANSFGKPVN